jgi:sugar lactone lactonase YvrE
VASAIGTPQAIATDLAGNVYFAVEGGVRRLDTSGAVATVAGTLQPGLSGDGVIATNTQIGWHLGLAVDASGAAYIADSTNNRVLKVSAAGVISTFAGTGIGGTSGDGGLATNAQLNGPSGVAVDGAGAVYIAESTRIRKVTSAGVISTVTGIGLLGYPADAGPPIGVVIDAAGALYISAAPFNGSGFGRKIWKLSSNGAPSARSRAGSQRCLGPE